MSGDVACPEEQLHQGVESLGETHLENVLRRVIAEELGDVLKDLRHQVCSISQARAIDAGEATSGNRAISRPNLQQRALEGEANNKNSSLGITKASNPLCDPPPIIHDTRYTKATSDAVALHGENEERIPSKSKERSYSTPSSRGDLMNWTEILPSVPADPTSAASDVLSGDGSSHYLFDVEKESLCERSADIGNFRYRKETESLGGFSATTSLRSIIHQNRRASNLRSKLDVFKIDDILTDAMARTITGQTSVDKDTEKGSHAINFCPIEETPSEDDNCTSEVNNARRSGERKPTRLNELQEQREQGLTSQIERLSQQNRNTGSLKANRGSSSSSSESTSLLDPLWQVPVFLLHISGILPLKYNGVCSSCNLIFPVMTFGLLIYYVKFAIGVEGFLCLRLSGVCYPVGALIGFTFLRFGNRSASRLLSPLKGLLSIYASDNDFSKEWLRSSSKYCFFLCCLWLTAAIIWLLVSSSVFTAPVASFFGPVVGGGLFTAIMCCHMHLCCHLELMVDTFCIGFFEDPDFAKAVAQWAVLQAMLRQAATSVCSCFWIAQTSVLIAVLLLVVEMLVDDGQQQRSWLWFASALPYVIIIIACLMRAAAVSEKCSRVPALVNTVLLDRSPLSGQRQYLVQYMNQTAAGFYINGVRLTAFMVMKMCYIFGMVLFALYAHVWQK